MGFIFSFILLYSQIDCLSVLVSFLSFCVVIVLVFGYVVPVEYSVFCVLGDLDQRVREAELFPDSAPSLSGYHYILVAASLSAASLSVSGRCWPPQKINTGSLTAC